jgi:integrase
MRLPHHLVRSSSGIFHFRLKVPVDLQTNLGLKVIKISLRTRSPALARVWSHALSLRYAQDFAQRREVELPKVPPSIAQILESFTQGQTRSFEIAFDPVTRGLTSLRTDGTPQDNAAALEALKAIHSQPRTFQATPAALPVKPKGSGLSLEDAVRLYEQAEAPSLKPNTWSQRSRAFASFKAAIGARTPVVEITRILASSWAHDLILGGMSKKTAGNQVSHVAQLFQMLLARGEIEGANPVKGVVVVSKKEKAARRQAGFQWEAFELDALKTIFDPANMARMRTEHVRWAAVIGLYTGARVGEIAQLFLRDFVMEGDQPCVKFTVESDGQTLKTEASERLVPLHPDLIRFGLWQRVERLKKAGEVRLFPSMRIDSKAGTGNAVSKGFSYYIAQLGIKPRRANGRVGFHSLRKTVIQALQGAKLPAERRRAFVGHEQGDGDVHEADYMRPWRAEELAELFPGLRWGEWLCLAANGR